MIYLKRYCWVSLIIMLMFILSSTGQAHADTSYKIISFKGKVKVKKNKKFISLKDQINITLNGNEALMVYPDALITVNFPNGKQKTLTGPFYSSLSAIETIDRETLDFFKQSGVREGIARIFDVEGQDAVGTTKGPHVSGDVNFYDEIKTAMAVLNLKDTTITPQNRKKMNTYIKNLRETFNAFSKTNLIILSALVWKSFGLEKKALQSVFTHYESVVQNKEKQKEIEIMEDSLFNEFLPIVVTIHRNSTKVTKNLSARIVKNHNTLPLKFSTNFRLWWAAFYSNGRDFENIVNTIDDSLNPQDTFGLGKRDFPFGKIGMKTKRDYSTNAGWLFVVACADWRELEKYDNINIAKNELLADEIKETKVNCKQNHGKVILKFSMTDER